MRAYHRIRFFKGLFTSLRILLSYRVARVAGAFMTSDGKAAYIKKIHRKNAAMIRQKAIEMKGVMIKVGQFLSSRIDLLPDEYIAELSQLQDQVPPHDYNEIREQIIYSLGAAPEDIFSAFEKDPIAAASLGQVHRAMLPDGKKVAVKVQYPGIEKIIETDIRMFGILIKILRGRYGRINLKVLHEEFSKIIRAELDYIQEGKNAGRFRENFAGDDRIVIPSVQWEFTRDKVLTLEFVEGIKINDCEAIKAAGIDCGKTVNLLAEAYSRMIFIHGFFHGDPHPGNIFVSEGPRLVFVDFGMVQAVPDSRKRELRQFANAIVERNTSGILDSLRSMGFIIEGADYSRLMKAAQYLMDRYRDMTPHELKAITVDDISKDIENVIGILDFIQIPNNFILLGRTIGILNGIIFRLNPEINMIEIGTPYIKEFLMGGKEERRNQLLHELGSRFSDVWKLPAQMTDFLAKANRGELSFKLARSEIMEIQGQFKSMTNVMMLVVLAVTTAASALFFILIGSRPLGVVAAGTAVVIGLLSVFRLMRS